MDLLFKAVCSSQRAGVLLGCPLQGVRQQGHRQPWQGARRPKAIVLWPSGLPAHLLKQYVRVLITLDSKQVTLQGCSQGDSLPFTSSAFFYAAYIFLSNKLAEYFDFVLFCICWNAVWSLICYLCTYIYKNCSGSARGGNILWSNFNKEEKRVSLNRIAINSEIKFQHSRELKGGDTLPRFKAKEKNIPRTFDIT